MFLEELFVLLTVWCRFAIFGKILLDFHQINSIIFARSALYVRAHGPNCLSFVRSFVKKKRDFYAYWQEAITDALVHPCFETWKWLDFLGCRKKRSQVEH